MIEWTAESGVISADRCLIAPIINQLNNHGGARGGGGGEGGGVEAAEGV